MIRPEQPADIEAIGHLNQQAFTTDAEAKLVNALRASASPFISLVAEREGTIIGHILFTPVNLTENSAGRQLMGLAPMAVLPAVQRQGIGSQLVTAGITACRKLEYDGIVVLGHPQYYPRFGFVPASLFDVYSNYEVPDEAFMILELTPGRLSDVAGTVQYHPAFLAL